MDEGEGAAVMSVFNMRTGASRIEDVTCPPSLDLTGAIGELDGCLIDARIESDGHLRIGYGSSRFTIALEDLPR